MIEWVLMQIKKELLELIAKRHTGKSSFEVNFFNGGVANVNVETKRSIKPPDKNSSLKTA